MAEPATELPFPEDRYQLAVAALRNPKGGSGGLILMVSFALFILLQEDRSIASLGVLVAVLLFHELGHYAGMRLFGYGDVRMFFIPFFGAAVSGKARGAAAWKEGIVSLLGPVPGIAAAFLLARHGAHDPGWATSTMRQVAISLVSINGFNLLPLAGLDGARLLQHVLFSRRRWLEILFQLCAALAMAAFAIESKSVALGVFAYLMVIVVPHRWRVLGQARRLRDSALIVPADARQMDDDVGRTLFRAAEGVTVNRTPKVLGGIMEQLVEAMNTRPPGLGASFALGFTWLASLVFALLTLVGAYGPLPAPPGGAPPTLSP